MINKVNYNPNTPLDQQPSEPEDYQSGLSDAGLESLLASDKGTPEQRARWNRDMKARQEKRNRTQQDDGAPPAGLSDTHLAALRQSAIDDQAIKDRGYRTITDADELRGRGFGSAQCQVPGLLLPLWTTDGGNSLCVYRPDNPRVIEDHNKKLPDGTHPNKVIKYEFPKGQAMRLDCPPVCQSNLSDPSIPLWITEGQKKADALASLGVCSIDILGVWNWRGSNSLGGKTVLADWEYVALQGRDVRIVFDSDIRDNADIQQAAKRLKAWLINKKAKVKVLYLPVTEGRGKTGVDDWLVDGHTLADLEALLQAPEPETRKTKRILSDEYLEVLGELGYNFRMLELDYTIEVNGEPLNDALEAEIKTRLRDRGYDLVNIARDAYIAHAYNHRYHPIKEYLEAQVWDGQDHIDRLAQHFADKDGVFLKWLRKWLIGAVARIYRNGVFNRVLILSGDQDIGKSYFARWLTRGLHGNYFTDSSIDPVNKDHTIRLMNVWIWEVGELHATTGRADRNALKSFLSREQVRERVAYGRNDIIRPALTSFIATANPEGGFLNDPTGNRRYATCELTYIDWDYAKDIDINQVWAQAKYLFDAGEDWRYAGEERAQVSGINDRFEIENPVHSWLDQIIEAKIDTFTPTTAILSELRFLGVRGSDKALTGDIASYMRKNEIERARARVNGRGNPVMGWRNVQLVTSGGPAAGNRSSVNHEQEEDYLP